MFHFFLHCFIITRSFSCRAFVCEHIPAFHASLAMTTIKVIIRAIFSPLSRLFITCLYSVAILVYVALTVILIVPVWLIFLLVTRLLKLIVTYVPPIAKNYKWMASSDALFFLPGLNESTDENGVPINQPYINFFTTMGGRADVERFRNKFAAYFRACDKHVDVDVDEEANDDLQIDEDTKKIFGKLLHYPVSKFGYTFWKRDFNFDLDYHLATLKRYFIWT